MKLSELKAHLHSAPIIPTLTIKNIDDAIPLAKALSAGGIKVLEVTLRTGAALDAIAQIRTQLPDLVVGAGTVLNVNDAQHVLDHGGQFIVSPGATDTLLDFMQQQTIAFIPGVITPSDIMRALDFGLNLLKYFPAEAMNGRKVLKAYENVFPQVSFCPTGGVNAENLIHYLELNNVICVGGAWISPNHAIEEKNWQVITDLSKSSLAKSNASFL